MHPFNNYETIYRGVLNPWQLNRIIILKMVDTLLNGLLWFAIIREDCCPINLTLKCDESFIFRIRLFNHLVHVVARQALPSVRQDVT